MAKDTPVYKKLAEKWTGKHRELQETLWNKHGNAIREFVDNTRNFAIGSASALMILTSPTAALLPPSTALTVQDSTAPATPDANPNLPVDKSVFLVSDLSNVVPQEVRPLSGNEEQKVGEILSRDFGVKASAELNGIRLNRSYGYIGAEQHLMRYPGDTMDSHFAPDGSGDPTTAGSGMAPGLGGWGYFARSASEMTQEENDREKWYIAVQSFLAPGFAEHTGEYIKFFKFRKMLVVNAQNGRAVVADIGDAGPAQFTGKHLGGSPEVMRYLQRVDGHQKGPVLYFFIDDPNNQVPLGPIDIK